jgi:hypothetical protein
MEHVVRDDGVAGSNPATPTSSCTDTCTTTPEVGGLFTFTKLEKRYLSRRVCAWCEMPLDREGCAAIYDECPPEVRLRRRLDCLSHYRPRPPSRPLAPSTVENRANE